jgi:hypothetical protein
MFRGSRWGEPQDHDSIVYIGDEVEIQNQFGAFQPMSYACTYNVQADKVTDVYLQPGKLPRE